MKFKLLPALLLLALPVHASDTFHWQSPAYIEQAFIEVALRNEYTASGQFVRKWQQPIKIWLEHKVPDQALHTDLVRMHIQHLSQLTQLPIQLVKNKDEANLTFVFTRQANWRQQVGELLGAEAQTLVQGAVCMANFRINQRAEIIRADVIIPVDQARSHGKLVACIVEEITQVLGLPNDSDRVYPSIFNDKTPEDLLSGLDGLLLKLLYHPSLKAGMKEQQARAAVRKIIQGWQQDGTIKQAAQQIKQGELYPLLGY